MTPAARRGLCRRSLHAVIVAAAGLAVSAAVPIPAEPPLTTSDIAELAKAAERYHGLPVARALAEQPSRIARRFAALPAHPKGPEALVLAIGGDGYQEIFDREAHRAAAVLGSRAGGPAVVLSNSPAQVTRGLLASRETVALAAAAIGSRTRPGDTLLVYLASHGGEDGSIAMDAPRLDFAPLSATVLARDLARAGIKRRIVIVSACYGATWIKPLASPSTIVIAAAAVDRTSFGCDDRRELTVFGKALLGELANRRQSLAQAFARAKLRIAAEERVEGATPSLPQAWVGRDMAAAWTRP